MTKDAQTSKIGRTCSKCRRHDEIEVSKRDIAFELVNIDDVLGKTCTQCSATSFSYSYEIPDLDFDLLKEWAINPDLHLMPQDEELLLADENYLDMILVILDTVAVHDYNRNLLMSALCVIVYDNSLKDNPQRDDRLRQRVINELNKREDKLKLADGVIMDYIKKVVYPQLNRGASM